MNALKIDESWFISLNNYEYLNKKFTIYKTIMHKDTWLLSCLTENITDFDLKTNDFNEAFNKSIKRLETLSNNDKRRRRFIKK
jgi:hypothetical protein